VRTTKFKEAIKDVFRSKLAVATMLFGWLVPITYISNEYPEYAEQADVLAHFLSTERLSETLFHILVLTAPFASTITAFLISAKKKHYNKSLESEMQLKTAATEWKTTFDSMPYGVIMSDGNFRIIRANNYIANLSGIPIKDLVFKKTCYELIHGKNTPCFNCPLERSRESIAKEKIDFYVNKAERHYMENVTPMVNDDGEIHAFVHSLIDINEIKEKEAKLTHSKDAFFNMLKDLDNTYKELKDIYDNLVIAFSNVIDAKSPWTRGHSVNVARYAESIAKEMALSEDDVYILRIGALLHDIGKIGTYDVILDKKAKLSDEEFNMIKMHPVQGEMILSPIKGLEDVLPVVRHHHEKLDGTGYPDQLKGDEISMLARILCVADAYDSMMSNRPYRNAVGRAYAIEELERCSGTQFDPEVTDAFLRVLRTEQAKTA
jgi:putative nucleotidyltransferase with HDIG domain/PAS domain S-box-containing protein